MKKITIITVCQILKHNDFGYYGNYGFVIGESSVTIDCYCFFPSNIEKIEGKGYLGYDGIVIGVNVGKTPYTIEPSAPYLTKSKISLDEDGKLLNVKFTVSPQ